VSSFKSIPFSHGGGSNLSNFLSSKDIFLKNSPRGIPVKSLEGGDSFR